MRRFYMTQETVTSVTLLPIEWIQLPEGENPTKNMDGDIYRFLVESVRQHGILEPIRVKKQEEKYVILNGRHRYRAAREIGLKEIPCIIVPDDPIVLGGVIYDIDVIKKQFKLEEIEKLLEKKITETGRLKKENLARIYNALPENIKKLFNIEKISSNAEFERFITFLMENSDLIEQKKSKEVEELQEKIRELEDALTEKEKILNKTINEYKAQFEEKVAQRVEKVLKSSKPTSDKDEIDKENQKSKIKKEVVEEYKKQIAELENEYEEVKEKLVNLSKIYDSAKKELELFKEENKKLKATRDALQAESEHRLDKISKLREYLESMASVETLKISIKTIVSALQSFKITYHNAQTVGLSEEEISLVKAEFSEVTRKIEEIEDMIRQTTPIEQFISQN